MFSLQCNLPKQLKYTADTISWQSEQSQLLFAQFVADEKTQRDYLKKLVGQEVVVRVPSVGRGQAEDAGKKQVRKKAGPRFGFLPKCSLRTRVFRELEEQRDAPTLTPFLPTWNFPELSSTISRTTGSESFLFVCYCDLCSKICAGGLGQQDCAFLAHYRRQICHPEGWQASWKPQRNSFMCNLCAVVFDFGDRFLKARA